MDKSRVIPLRPASGRGLRRREILQGLLAGVGATAALPMAGEAHPIQQHLHNTARVGAAEAAVDAGKGLEFLDQHQFETLQILCEQLIPGSGEVKTAEFLDKLLAVDSQETQREFLGALGAFDAEARELRGKPYKALATADQIAILEKAAAMAPSKPEPPAWVPGQQAVTRPQDSGSAKPGDAPPPSEPRANLHDFFSQMRGWVAGAYYSTEKGLRELGWTGNVFFDKLPGCEHGEGSHG